MSLGLPTNIHRAARSSLPATRFISTSLRSSFVPAAYPGRASPLGIPSVLPKYTGQAVTSFLQRRSNSGVSEAEQAARDQGEQVIYDKLKAKFSPKTLDVMDVSGGCGSFYAIHISSTQFNNLSTVKQHRLVNDCLKEEIKGVHGLQLKTVPEHA